VLALLSLKMGIRAPPSFRSTHIAHLTRTKRDYAHGLGTPGGSGKSRYRTLDQVWLYYFFRSRVALARARVEYGANAAAKLLPVINAAIDRCAAIAFSATMR
jgi:hypothetical protein